ncbi:hypothetical protein [Jeotgalibacillus soli]|uniref:Uncharacterized protein n=1 Tax=Jeotgalibacillus soli TaxID=889306 RepID=A0A0C2R0U2_9BACL|nr:hypothetical protein [Jeotgalibacillus soli]KIL43930.1 hypothetical protein KP78_37540 [Jeotgalibacillus soli]
MKFNIGFKVFFSILLIAFLVFFSFIGIIFTLLSGLTFYTPIIIITALGPVVFFIYFSFQLLKTRVLKISFITFIALCVVTAFGFQLNHSYHQSIPTVNDHEVNLYQYQPFYAESLAVRLDEESSLSLDENLPVINGATALYPLYAAFFPGDVPRKTV